MVVQHNLTAMNANRYLGINNSKLSKSLEKLSSGYAINRAGDNAAGLAVSEKMRSQIAGMTQAVKNAQDGISMVQTFEGALTETDSILQRMKTLADQMANGTYDDPVDRTAAQQEFLQLNDELDQIADTDFNGVVVLNGGVMSDGTRATGVTDSKNDRGVITRTLDETVENAGLIDYTAKADDSSAAASTDPVDLKDDANLDDSKWTQADATAMWADFGLTEGTDKEITLSFKKTTDANDPTKSTWAVDKAYDADGNEIKDFDKTKVTVSATASNGGFTVKSANGTNEVNVVVNTIDAADGSSVAVKFTNDTAKPIAPDNIGISDTTTNDGVAVDNTNDTLNITVDEDAAKAVVFTLHDDVKDNFETDTDIQEAIKALNGSEVSFDIIATGGAAATTTALDDTSLKVGSDTNFTYDAANNVIQYKGKNIAKLSGSFIDTPATRDAGAAGNNKVTVTYKVNVDGYSIPTGAGGFDANIVADPAMGGADAADSDYKVSVSNKFNNSEAKMTYKDSITLQVGARTKDAVNFTFKYDSTAIGDLTADLDCSASGLGTNLLNLNTQKDANFAIDKIDQAINKVSLVRGTFGAIQNRLEHKIDNLNVSVENLTSAESQIRDTNMPQEMMNFTKQQILAQASQSMLAQANQLPQGVLSLLQ